MQFEARVGLMAAGSGSLGPKGQLAPMSTWKRAQRGGKEARRRFVDHLGLGEGSWRGHGGGMNVQGGC